MNSTWSLEQVEWWGIGSIIFLQLYLFVTTWLRIRQFRQIFDETDRGSVVRLAIPVKELQEKKAWQILQQPDSYRRANGSNQDREQENTKEVDVILFPPVKSRVFSEIVTALNIYLLKNRGAASDFHLIKDVVERNSDTLDEEITHTISLPLYLGLLGTFLGIVLGMWSIHEVYSTQGNEGMDKAIGQLFGGVKIAMIASFSGLLLTIINNGWSYKGARVHVENEKNRFYTFLQTELLPVLNQNINSTLYSLQNNLHKFNDVFSGNVMELSQIMNRNYDSLKAQENVLDSLEKIDITQFAKANVTILKELNVSVTKFEEFNRYFSQVNTMLYGTKVIVQKVNELIEKTDQFQGLAGKANESFEFSRNLQEFLRTHYSALENAQSVFDNKLTNVNDALFTSLDKLKEFTQAKIQEMSHVMTVHLDQLNTVYPEKLNKLDNLVYLESVRNNVDDIKKTSSGQFTQMKKEIGEMNGQMQTISAGMQELLSEVRTFRESQKRPPKRFLGFLWKMERRA